MSGCSCEIDDYGECDSITIHEGMRTAKKEHRCGECSEVISPGDKYEYVAGKCEGDFFTAKTCEPCVQIRNAFFCTWMYGRVMEAFEEYLREVDGRVSSECILMLGPEAREIAFEMIEEVWADIDDDE